MLGFRADVVLLVVAQLNGLSSAFQIHGGMIAHTRLDPIISPNGVSSHVSLAIGGSNFGPKLSTDILRNSKCSSLETQEDKSSYWVAPLYGRNKDGTWTALPSTYHAISYTRTKTGPMNMFPKDFRMIVGDAAATSQKPTKDWLSYECHNYIPRGDITGQWNFTGGFTVLPQMDCTTVKQTIIFPNCWDGVNVDSADHRSHMSYATGEGGKCPSDHPLQVPQLILEFEFYTEGYKWQDIVMSSGSLSGAAGHASFFYGWSDKGIAAVKKAMEEPTCNGGVGILPWLPAQVRCDIMAALANEAAMYACGADASVAIVQEESGIQTRLGSLPGYNPIYDGPNAPLNKPPCQNTPQTPAIGSPSRLVSWADGDPRHKVHIMAVYDGFKPAPPTGPASGTIYITTGQNWDGTAENFLWNNGDCKKLPSPYASNVGSAGPDKGTCTFYDDTACSGSSLLTMKYPGTNYLGSLGKKFKSYKCV